MTDKKIYVDGKQLTDVQMNGSSARFTEIMRDGKFHSVSIVAPGRTVTGNFRGSANDAEPLKIPPELQKASLITRLERRIAEYDYLWRIWWRLFGRWRKLRTWSGEMTFWAMWDSSLTSDEIKTIAELADHD